MENLIVTAKALPGLKAALIITKLPTGIKKQDCFFELYKRVLGEKDWIFMMSKYADVELEDPLSIYDIKPSVAIEYRVIVSTRVDHTNIGEGTCILQFNQPNAHALLAETNYIKYLEVTNSPYFYIFHTSVVGERCSCWDDVRKESSDPQCPICAGYGMLSGMTYVGKNRFVLLNSNKAEASINETFLDGTIKTTPMQSWTTLRYIIKPDDILVRASTNIAYRVNSVNYSTINDKMVRQDMVFSEIESGHVIYDHLERMREEYE